MKLNRYFSTLLNVDKMISVPRAFMLSQIEDINEIRSVYSLKSASAPKLGTLKTIDNIACILLAIDTSTTAVINLSFSDGSRIELLSVLGIRIIISVLL
ncbi:Hypothetical predicted protein [Octopus vulgaris]|uniref:Uncharacterized protein n=1 Tax=Octopus vulgaris TaxID=6645 RepID=A0AA36FB95_OCTVU|nr:Hypothetical predicted protein [Octopus vulgaris]